MTAPLHVRIAAGDERAAALDRLRVEWGDPILVRGRSYSLDDCQIHVAGDFQGIAAVCLGKRPVAELAAINAFERGRGIGTALIEAVVASLEGFEGLRLTTTNDNLDALRFYQRRGFRLAALRAGAVDAARRLKPTIPALGDYGIAVRDEIDLVLSLPRG